MFSIIFNNFQPNFLWLRQKTRQLLHGFSKLKKCIFFYISFWKGKGGVPDSQFPLPRPHQETGIKYKFFQAMMKITSQLFCYWSKYNNVVMKQNIARTQQVTMGTAERDAYTMTVVIMSITTYCHKSCITTKYTFSSLCLALISEHGTKKIK